MSAYVEPGRDLSLDESSVASRSKYGRHLILYNPTKPGGKYHFKYYALTTTDVWICLDIKVHSHSTIHHRLQDVLDPTAVAEMAQTLEKVSDMRANVLEVTRKFWSTKRVLNIDNYYTSPQLIDGLFVHAGLYCRGTCRQNRKHFPLQLVLPPNAPRGSSRVGVCVQSRMLGGSWVDGAVVTFLSNADASGEATVQRQVGASKETFTCPIAIPNYNQNMQGVDRVDQLMKRFSLAAGHSFQKWHLKMAFSLIDIAVVNAFQTRKLAIPTLSQTRDAHRDFVVNLAAELISGAWDRAPIKRVDLLFESSSLAAAAAMPTPVAQESSASTPLSTSKAKRALHFDTTPSPRCIKVSSGQALSTNSTDKRRCCICRFEDRKDTIVTCYCSHHDVCMCTRAHIAGEPKPWMCPDTTLTCWEKYHEFYLPEGLFDGKTSSICRTSKLNRMKTAEKKQLAESSIIEL